MAAAGVSASVVVGRAELSGAALPTLSWAVPPRRLLQMSLAMLWLLDGVLQLQPFFFTRTFGGTMLAATARGNPAWIARSITWGGAEIAAHASLADGLFAAAQLLIAAGIAYRPTTKVVLALSIPWSLGVWWFGEGLGGILTPTASPLMGEPGAVLLYALLAVLLWPTDREAGDGTSVVEATIGRIRARGLWFVLFGAMAGLALVGRNLAAGSAKSMVLAMLAGEPGWLSSLDHRLAGVVAGRGGLVSVVTACLLAAIAISGLVPWRRVRLAGIALAILVSSVIWVAGENFGGILSGSGTDPSSGPLLILLSIAYLLRDRAVVRSAPDTSGPVL